MGLDWLFVGAVILIVVIGLVSAHVMKKRGPSPKRIKYMAGNWKYKLLENYYVACNVGVKNPKDSKTELITLYPDGVVVRKGYAWDGPSGPTWDTETGMRGSLVHDALYQCIREGIYSPTKRRRADRILKTVLKEDRMNILRRTYWYWGVRIGGKRSTKPR